MSKYAVNKGMEMPDASRGRYAGGRSKYPIHDMEVGDSFFLGDGQRSTITSSFAKACKGERKFASRKEGNGIRVWRTA